MWVPSSVECVARPERRELLGRIAVRGNVNDPGPDRPNQDIFVARDSLVVSLMARHRQSPITSFTIPKAPILLMVAKLVKSPLIEELPVIAVRVHHAHGRQPDVGCRRIIELAISSRRVRRQVLIEVRFLIATVRVGASALRQSRAQVGAT